MCGICGRVGMETDLPLLRAANNCMRHRGPDDDGFYITNDVALAMRRLSIIDVAGGQQPKTNETESVRVVFNGEIYNFRELRDDLASRGHVFDSDSDTEVIAHAYEQWGCASFASLTGIFAIALWDAAANQLVLARDHLGVKPLYYSLTGNGLVFASELTPMRVLLPSEPEIDRVSAQLYLRYHYVPCPRSIYQGVNKLPPGHYLTAPLGGKISAPQRFWSPFGFADRKTTQLSVEDAENLVDETLRAAVHRQLVSDVPLGAFLSGGIDSSLVVAMMQSGSNGQAQTFSIGFEEARHDESACAQAVAAHLHTNHHAWTITETDARAAISKLPRYFDEPFGDPSALPTFLVSEFARRHVTVALSGDGGDELFGGYASYRQMRWLRYWWALPERVREGVLPLGQHSVGPVRDLFVRAEAVMRAGDRHEGYRLMMSPTRDPELDALTKMGGGAYASNPEWPAGLLREHGTTEGMMLTDLVTYLPDDILTKVDRASMAHSLEARVPLLDPLFVETVLALPVGLRTRWGNKTLLRRVLKRYLPDHLVDRPKHGFGIPVASWLRGGLAECLQDYLSPDRLDNHGIFAQDVVARMQREHLTGERDWGSVMWSLLMFQMWHEVSRAVPDAGRERGKVPVSVS